MKTILQPTKEELKKAEEKFNRLHNRFYTALSILHDATAELPQKGNTAVERVENEVNLKLTNRIDLSNLDLNFVNNED